eukprot:11421617-Prorocentrum_lima.AAC.1
MEAGFHRSHAQMDLLHLLRIVHGRRPEDEDHNGRARGGGPALASGKMRAREARRRPRVVE